MIAADRRLSSFNQIDADLVPVPAPNGALSPVTYFLLAVSAGVTVWFVTRWLERRR